MARGMAAGEPIVSQALTKEFEEGYERTFGADRKVVRGRWIWDERQGKLVSAEEYQNPEMAQFAPIVMDRHYENTSASDGTDIGSRRKHKAYMKAHGLTTADDFSRSWSNSERERQAIRKGENDKKERREQIGRALYERNKP